MKTYEIRAVGKPVERWQSEAVQTFVERLSPYAKIVLKEVPEGHGGSAKPDPNKTRKTEAASLLKSLPDHAVVIALDETGKNLASEVLAQELDRHAEGGTPIVFIIGGSWGLDESVRDRADLVLSFGKQTLPHSLAKIVLLEQLFRAETILRGKTYHK